jgi:hypothetical protein
LRALAVVDGVDQERRPDRPPGERGALLFDTSFVGPISWLVLTSRTGPSRV